MLSNTMAYVNTAYAGHVTAFSIRFNNSDRFQFYGVTRSYSNRLFL